MPYGTISADVIQSSVTGVSLGAGNATRFKNRIINGNMVIDQRNAGASITPTNGQFSVDRWNGQWTQSGKFTMQQNAGSVTPPAGFTNYLGMTSTSAYSIVAGDIFQIAQVIEGYNMADFGWGTANAQTVTLSFWVRSSLTGTFGGALVGGQNYVFSYTINSANTWEQKSITITGSTSGTWASTVNAAITLVLSIGCGSTYLGTPGSWTASVVRAPTGQTSVVGTNGATFYITGVQLEVGSSATGFEYVDYTTQLAMCQRYYEIFSGVALSTASIYKDFYYRVTKRTAPTIVNTLIAVGTGLTFTSGNVDRCYQEALNSGPSNFTAAASAEL